MWNYKVLLADYKKWVFFHTGFIKIWLQYEGWNWNQDQAIKVKLGCHIEKGCWSFCPLIDIIIIIMVLGPFSKPGCFTEANKFVIRLWLEHIVESSYILIESVSYCIKRKMPIQWWKTITLMLISPCCSFVSSLIVRWATVFNDAAPWQLSDVYYLLTFS